MFQTDGQMISLIYGRRRIGKSELIRQVLKETELKSIYYECKQTTEQNNVDSLSELVGETFDFPKPAFADMESLLRNYLAAKGETPFIGIIHRLDQPVEGVMVFGKTKEATAELNRQMQKNGFGKYYLTVVYGKAEPKEGQLIDFLKKDGRSNTSSVVKQGPADAKRAALTYRVLQYSTLDDRDDRDGRDGKAASGAGTADGTSEKTEAAEEISLLEVKLETGRHHQIRVQMSHHGWPLVGDRKYGRKNESLPGMRSIPLALCSYRLEFLHPTSKKKMQFQITPEGQAFHLFSDL